MNAIRKTILFAVVLAVLTCTPAFAATPVSDEAELYAPLDGAITFDEFQRIDPVKQRQLSDWARTFNPEYPLPAACFNEDASPEVRAAVEAFYARHATRFNGTDSGRWSTTATDGFVFSQGQPITITWSIVPDGTSLGAAQVPGETSGAPSNLVASFDAEFGSTPAWVAHFTSVFAEWSRLTGIDYVMVSDDGAAFPTSPGVLGLRGDVRIGGRTLDGPGGGVLAYNFFPDTGDMVFDTGNTADFFGNPSNSFRPLRNTISHEHGYGLGFFHVCPLDSTKIMEPIVPLGIDHSGPDDIAHANRKYGDANEKSGGNDTAGTATNEGAIGVGTTVIGAPWDPTVRAVSLDSVFDQDFYSIDLTIGDTIDVRAIPSGSTFLFADDPGGLCSGASTAPYNSLNVIDLRMQLIDTNGVTVLETADSAAAGVREKIAGFTAPATGTYFLRIYTSDAPDSPANDQVQLYRINIVSPAAPPASLPLNPWAVALPLLTLLIGTGIWRLARRNAA